MRSYDGNDGQKRWVTEVIAEQVEFVGSKNDNNSNQSSGGAGNSGGSAGGNSGYDSNPGLGLGEEVVFDDNDLPF